MPESSRELGKVTVAAGGDQIPIAVRDAALRLVHQGLAGESFSLQSGLYLVQALLPDRVGVEERLTVKAGSNMKVDLGQQMSPSAPISTGASVDAPDVVDTFVVRVVEALGRLLTGSESEKTPRSTKGSTRNASRRPERAVPSWAFRFGAFIQDSELGFAWQSGVRPRVEESEGSVVIRLSVPSGTTTIAQILRRGQVPLNVMMPGSSEHQGEAVLVATRRKGRYVFAAFPPGNRVGLAARFLATGEADQGARLLSRDDAVSLLESKMADPVGAAVGAYLLLRIGDLDAMRDWTMNLANRFPWLPDGSIAEGERLLRKGKHAPSIRRFVEATTRGLPLFTEGYSILFSRLRQFAIGEHLDASSGDQEVAKRRIDWLSQWTPFVDLGAPTLTFTGEDPMDPSRTQTPSSRGVSLFRFERTRDGLQARG